MFIAYVQHSSETDQYLSNTSQLFFSPPKNNNFWNPAGHIWACPPIAHMWACFWSNKWIPSCNHGWRKRKETFQTQNEIVASSFDVFLARPQSHLKATVKSTTNIYVKIDYKHPKTVHVHANSQIHTNIHRNDPSISLPIHISKKTSRARAVWCTAARVSGPQLCCGLMI